MTQAEQRKAAKKFSEDWKGKGYEKGMSQKFWLDLLCNVFGVQDFASFITFEEPVKLEHTSFIDAYIPSTKVLIEQKSIDKDLKAAIKQSDNSFLTPFQQAKRYIMELPVSKHPRRVITCNFKSFLVYDMEKPNGSPEEILLENLEKEVHRLSFLTETGNERLKKELEVSKKAGELIGEIYDAILSQYHDSKNPSPATLKSLNMLCVRLVFCLYAEDAGIFRDKSMFGEYLKGFEAKDLRRALLLLFQVLDQKTEEREEYLEESLAAFPYVNGGLFTEEDKRIPQLTEEIKDLLVQNASAEFDWSEISPTIFGSIFESTLNPEIRRSGGMHYTSIENIHKVIDPLFMDELKAEFEKLKAIKVEKERGEKLLAFQKKLGSLKFLDPACGSGNFLTESYLSLRRLENECIKLRLGKQASALDLLGEDFAINVKIEQFYGIEINDFATVVAKTALWIAESQMMSETARILGRNLDFLPLKSYANIVEGNALRLDWESVICKNELNYIMGNPPFVGYSLQSGEQKKDMLSVYLDKNGKTYKTAGKIDYVSAWYYKTSQYIQKTNIRCALVATNSITQGEQVVSVWKPLVDLFGIHIDFAYQTFRWDSESNLKAHVHCVIIGFSCSENKRKKIIFLNSSEFIETHNINAYLLDGDNIWIESRSNPLCDAPLMTTGNRPADGGHLIIEAEEYDTFIKKETKAIKYIKNLTGSKEYINNKKRYCLWLVDVPPTELITMPEVMKRVESCRKDRLKGAPDRQKLAHMPTLFRETKNPKSYLIIPGVSSENRKYIPIGFLNSDTIPTDTARIIPDATCYHFGILTSSVHMAWMRAVAGRLKSDYSYSKDIVYNNFPWCDPTDDQKKQIEKTAAGILDARAKYPESSLATLYGKNMYLFSELVKAHQANDRAVLQAYGFPEAMSESECVAELFKMYERLKA